MNAQLTELVFLLDRSGSMAGLEEDTIGGFNAMLEKQRGAEGEALASTVLFNGESAVLHDRVDVRRVEPMTRRQYAVGGCTALLDAVGRASSHIGDIHRRARAGLSPREWRTRARQLNSPSGGLMSQLASPVRTRSM